MRTDYAKLFLYDPKRYNLLITDERLMPSADWNLTCYYSTTYMSYGKLEPLHFFLLTQSAISLSWRDWITTCCF